MRCYYSRLDNRNGMTRCEHPGIRNPVVPTTFCDDRCPFRVNKLRGLGDLLERILTFFGITNRRYAKITGQKTERCRACDERIEVTNEFFEFGEDGWPSLFKGKRADKPPPDQLH